MSDDFREVLNSILDEIYGQFLAGVAASRGKSAEEVRGILDNGPFIPQQALDAGLVDGLLYPDQFFDLFKQRLELDEIHKVSQGRYRKVTMESLGLGGDHPIAIVYAVGTILRGESEADPVFGTQVLGSDSFSETLRQVREDETIEAVIVRINSPGGDAWASDQIWRELNLLRETKPLVLSMSDVAASGGYYLAMADAPIVAYPGTQTGSIGVFFGKFNLRGFYDKIGVKKDILTRGRFAAIDSDYRTLTPEERAKLREGLEATYQTFVQKVADSRERDWNEIHELAQGRVWMGTQAKQQGLVDELGGFDRAITMVKEAAGLDDDAKVRLITYPPPKRFIDVLLNRGENAQASQIQSLLRSYFGSIPWPALLRGGTMRLAPYSITVQ